MIQRAQVSEHETVCPQPPYASPMQNQAMSNQEREHRFRLVLLDGAGLFRASLARFLSSEPDLEVAGECGTSADALRLLAQEAIKGSAIDLILLDFDIGTEHGTDFISAARQAGYQGRFLIVAGSADVRNSAAALRLGASGIFLKSEAPERLVQAIRLVGNDGIWVDKSIIQTLADQFIERYPRLEDEKALGSLEGLERQVLLGIVEGNTNRKIGESMGLSESKIKNTVQRLFGRAGVKTRGQLVRAALEGSLGTGQDFVKRHPNEMPNPHH